MFFGPCFWSIFFVAKCLLASKTLQPACYLFIGIFSVCFVSVLDGDSAMKLGDMPGSSKINPSE